MRRKWRRRANWPPPELTEAEILAWADAHHARSGGGPHQKSGPIPGSDGGNWRKVDNALRLGLRGMERGSSLARLLARERGVRSIQGLPPYTVRLILGWADAFHA